ncbi:MAG: 50S ribosomal protein L19 [Candidatus Melainabacteria bacterium]|jgi:large subunit ribosomal protein L19|nr:50S ribosomal protein L19 [Candidatus Melainabacteria bacterium]
MNQLIKDIESKHLKAEPPVIRVGDTVKVETIIQEASGKERSQHFEGLIIARAGTGVNETFRVRRIFQGIGIERTFLVHSPKIRAVKIIRSGRTRRAKLYFLRSRIGTKATRLRNLQMQTTQEKSNSAD